MRFHGLMLLRDEGDIIAETLEHLLSWIDGLYILDMGSIDGTWEIVQDFSRREKRIVPVFSRPIVYDDNLRSLIFNQFRDHFSPGDWVMKIDGDEHYHVPPPQFVRERLRPMETAVYLQWYFFRLTLQEAIEYESGRVSVSDDRRRPISERRRYYKISTYAEPRMFRYRRSMRWPHDCSFPFNAGFVSRERIPIRHYPHRDPPQMQQRYQLRAAIMRLNAHAGNHWKLEDWRKELVDAAGVSAAAAAEVKVGLSGENGIDTGPLHHWTPNTPLMEVPFHNHIPAPRTRVMQRVIHPMLLPLLDATRRRYDPSYRPEDIPQAVSQQLIDALPVL